MQPLHMSRYGIRVLHFRVGDVVFLVGRAVVLFAVIFISVHYKNLL